MNKPISLLLMCLGAQIIHAVSTDEIQALLKGKKHLAFSVIIGSGPAGYAAAIPLARAGFQPIVFQGPKPLGELMDAAVVENWPAVAKDSGAANMNKLEKQALQFGVLLDSGTITDIDFSVWPFKLTTSNNTNVYALTVIIATGASQRKLGIKNEDVYWGRGLFSCGICDASFTEDKDAVIIGGGDIAIQRALQIAPRAKTVTLIVPGSRMTAEESMQKKISCLKHVNVVFNKEVKKIEGDGTNITHVDLYDPTTDQKSMLKTQCIFLSTGLTPNIELFKDKLELDQYGCIKLIEGRTQETAIPGVKAAGNVADPRYRQVASVIGDATKAGIDALKDLSQWGFDGALKETVKDRLYKPLPLAPIKQIRSLSELKKTIANESRPMLVEFYSPLCSHCKKMEAPLSALALKFKDVLKVYKVNKDKLFKSITTHEILIIPAFILFNDGKEVNRIEGETSQQNLFDFVEENSTFTATRHRSLCLPLDAD